LIFFTKADHELLSCVRKAMISIVQKKGCGEGESKVRDCYVP